MRSTFSEWYPLSEEDHSSLLNDGTITLDASALLTLYRLSLGDRRKFLDLLDAVKARVWVAYQAGLEYQRNRINVYSEQLRAYDQLRGSVIALRNELVNSVRTHPVLSGAEIRREFEDRLNSLLAYVDERQEHDHPEDLVDPDLGDGVRDALDAVLAGRVGNRPTDLDQRYKEAQRRIDASIPPGYLDKKKEAPRRYGDYLIWREVLDHTSGLPGTTKPLLFVTEEKKEDWWRKSSDGRLLGPRHELIREAADLGIGPIRFVSLRRFYEDMAETLHWSETTLGAFSSLTEPDDPEADGQPAEATGEDSPSDDSP